MSVTLPHAAAWISVTPSIGQRLHLLPNEFQVAVQWWLGINPSSSLDGTQIVCPFCPSKSLDTLGYHCVTFQCGGDVTTRHNALRNVLHTTFHRAGLFAHLEQGSGWSDDKSRSRPADILVANWDRGLSAAFDISVTSPLNPSLIVEAGTSSGVAARVAEERTHEKNDEKCSELGWQCIPIVVETYGSWGSEAKQALSQLASRLAVQTNSEKSQMLGSLCGHLSMTLVRANARAILNRFYCSTLNLPDNAL